MQSKGWFDNFRDCLKYQGSRSRGSLLTEAADQFPDAIKKIAGEKNTRLIRFLMQMNFSYSGENATKRHLVVRKRSEQQTTWAGKGEC